MYSCPQFETPQGVHSDTFTPPPFDQYLSIPECYAYHAKNSPCHPLFTYADGNTAEVNTISYFDAYQAIRKAHKQLVAYNANTQDEPTEDIPVVGILANSDTITYFTLMVGIMHAGFTPFPISTRNSLTGVAHLMRTTGTRRLFCGDDPAMKQLATDACNLLGNEGIQVHNFPMPKFEDIYNDTTVEDLLPLNNKPNSVVMILHSSGTTAQPKPVKFTNCNFRKWGYFAYHGEVDVCGMTLAAQSLPMFHAMGSANIVWTVFTGLVMACFKPSSPAIFPTPDIFLRSIVATRSQIIFCVPAFVETWCRYPENIPILRNLTALIYAGGPLNQEVGITLAEAGVNLMPFYGSTECGAVSLFVRKSSTVDDWQYFKLSSQIDVEMVPQDEDGTSFEPVIIESESFCPNAFNTTVNGQPAFATNDLLRQHPVKNDMYIVYGRIDDQLMLSTGEKTNPVPLETMLLQDAHIAGAVMFGRGRFQNGVLIQPHKPFEPNDEEKLAAFRNLVWLTIEKVNTFAPAHSRIFKEMIIVTHPGKPLELTAKGTPRRQLCLQAYETEINRLYEVVETSSQTGIPIPEAWTFESALTFVDTAVRRVMQYPISPDQDFFQYGCDSLKATWIRNSLLRAIRSSVNKAKIHLIPFTFVYSNPTIRKLGQYFWDTLNGSEMVTGDKKLEWKVLEMEALATKYSANTVDVRKTDGVSQAQTETILLTGSTGRYGSHILRELLNSPHISKIFALNRRKAGGVPTGTRQSNAFYQWGIEVDSISLKKVEFIEYDLNEEQLGLDNDIYDILRTSVTTIIHNGWRVDFNIELSSFEPLIAGTRQLLDLACSSTIPNGPKFIFISSVSVFAGLNANTPAPESAVPAYASVGMAYGESKWVAEEICRRISESHGLRLSTVRVGQLSGDTAHGRWNKKEWVPALLNLGKAVGSIPSRNEDITWLPVDDAARAVRDLLRSTQTLQSDYLNLVHPHPVPWNVLFAAFADQLKVSLDPYSQWVEKVKMHITKLDSTDRGSEDLSGLLISDEGLMKSARQFTMTHTLDVCRSLGQVEPLSSADAKKYLKFWSL